MGIKINATRARLGKIAGILLLYENFFLAFRNRLMPNDTGRSSATYRLRPGVELTVDSTATSVGIVNEIWIDKVYEAEEGFQPQPGWTVLDIGANQGVYSIYAAKLGAKVHAVEPEPGNLDKLRKNVEANDVVGKSVTIYPYALSSAGGDVDLFYSSDNVGGHSVLGRDSATHMVTVSGISLEELVQRAGGFVDLLKLDIEGGEYSVLEQATQETMSKIRRIAMETHETGTLSPQAASTHIEKTLSEFGYTVRVPRIPFLFAFRH